MKSTKWQNGRPTIADKGCRETMCPEIEQNWIGLENFDIYFV